MTKPEVSRTKMTAYTAENLDKMVKTYTELRIQSFSYLKTFKMRCSDACSYLNPCVRSQRMSNTFESIFSVRCSDSQIRLKKGVVREVELVSEVTIDSTILHA